MRFAVKPDVFDRHSFAPGRGSYAQLFCRIISIAALAGAANMAAMQVPSNVPGKTTPPRARDDHGVAKHRATNALRGEVLQPEAAGATDGSAAAPKPAVVTLRDGVLTVKANDSGLRQILDNIAVLGSMSIDGQVSDSRVYGSYGPGVPSAVILNLLDGAGYNVILAGVNSRGAPQKLILTPKTGEVSAPSEAAVAVQSTQPDGPEVNSLDGEPLGPGAIANVPPPPSEDPETRMKQTIERLQQMQDQQKQPQEPTQQQPPLELPPQQPQ